MLPTALVEPLERWMSRLPGLAAVAQNVIYVVRAEIRP